MDSKSRALEDYRELLEAAASHPIPEDVEDRGQYRLQLLDRLEKAYTQDREWQFRAAEQSHSARNFRANTPLVIALTGILTIAANFLVSFLLKDQDAQVQASLARLEATVTENTRRLEAEIAVESRSLEFQYSMIEQIMAASADESVTDIELERARQLLFLSRTGLLPVVKSDELEKLVRESVGATGEVVVGLPTLPSPSTSAPLGTRLTPASQDLITTVLGPPGQLNGCTPPLVQIDLPFDMRVAWNPTQTLRRISVHEAAEPYFRKALELIVERGQEQHVELFGGVYAPRRTAGSQAWSRHSWGIAIDIDPDGNQLRWGRDRARLPTEVARTMEDAAFYSSGLARDQDWADFSLSAEALREIQASGYQPWDGTC
jgi:hypothetical protein